MILQALTEYYERKSSDPDSVMVPFGWERKEISFILTLSDVGELIQIEDMRESNGKGKKGKLYNVPLGEIRTSGIKANLLWDSAEYILGIGKKGQEKKEAFVKRLKNELSGIDDVKPVIHFLENYNEKDFEKFNHWEEIKNSKQSPNLSFRINGHNHLIFQSNEIKKKILDRYDELPFGTCLITGEKTRIKDLHKEIKGVPGAQPSGAKIVSFNLSSFSSYGKENGSNSPVGIEAEFAYTTALNTLLAKDSHQKIVIGEVLTIVFWAEKRNRLEDTFSFLFQDPPKDDPDSGTRRIKELFEAVNKGFYIEPEVRNKFYVLGLGPNAARIAIRFWKITSINELAKEIKQYFEDFDIIKPKGEQQYYSISKILRNLSIRNETENIRANLSTELIMSILSGSLYPLILIQAAIRSIISDSGERKRSGKKGQSKKAMRSIISDSGERVNSVRAAALKAYLNRYYRLYPNKMYKEIKTSLDIDQPSTGYQLGRLFATLEKIQENANPNLNSTIRERYYGAACTSPVTVFPTLLRLKNYHIVKIESKGVVVYFEQIIGEIMGKIIDFPAHLGLHEQGLFSVGYYHQRQKFYTKKESKDSEIIEEDTNIGEGDDK